MLGSIHDAEDVVQDTLLRAWRSLERFEGRSSVETWLYRIATNACLDELETRPRPRPVEPYPDARLEDADTSIADPAARYALREGMELAFLTAIQRLPGRQRAVLILRDVLGWTAAEAAELLDTTVTAVNSALQRARATIEAEAPAHRVAPGRGVQRELLRRYVDAWERADMDALLALLREDAVMTMPPAGRPASARQAIVGVLGAPAACGVRPLASATWVNGAPAVELHEPAGELHRAADPRRRRRPHRRHLRVRPASAVKRGDPHLGGPRPSEDQACVAGGRSVKLKVSALRLPSLSDITQGSEKNSASKRETSSGASCWTQCDVSKHNHAFEVRDVARAAARRGSSSRYGSCAPQITRVGAGDGHDPRPRRASRGSS